MPGRRRHARGALVLVAAALLLTGCQRHGDQDRAAALETPPAESIIAAYAACRERAGGDAPRLIACADAAVLAAVPGDAGAAFAVVGDVANAQAGASLAQRAGVADALASLAIERATLREGSPLPRADERPVPALLARAAAPIVSGTCVGAGDPQACEAGRDRLLPRLAARLSALTQAGLGVGPKAALLGGYTPPTCGAVRAAATADAALGEFESEFPAALKDERLVETIVLGDDQVRAISAYLACLAARTGFAPDVIDSSLAFFASRQSGARARASLDRLGKDSGSDAVAAREFAGQVSDYLSAPDG